MAETQASVAQARTALTEMANRRAHDAEADRSDHEHMRSLWEAEDAERIHADHADAAERIPSLT
jgi:hypothetical protein